MSGPQTIQLITMQVNQCCKHVCIYSRIPLPTEAYIRSREIFVESAGIESALALH